MFKKSFFVLATFLYWQSAKSDVVICNNWREVFAITAKVCSDTNNPGSASAKSLFGVDCNGVLFRKYEDHATYFKTKSELCDNPEDLFIIQALQKMSAAGLPFFCMTAMPSTERIAIRHEFIRLGLAPFFEDCFCFEENWNHQVHGDTPFIIDSDWNTVYTCRMPSTEFNDSVPIDTYEMQKKAENGEDVETWTRYVALRKALERISIAAKGNVLTGLIQMGFLTKPDVFVFVDDKIENLRSMKYSCAMLRIEFVGILYKIKPNDEDMKKVDELNAQQIYPGPMPSYPG